MNERDELIKQLIKEKGGTREDYLSLLNKIAHHESAGTMDPSIKQLGGGPGRGKFQFEVGKNQGAITAAKRTKQYLAEKNLKVPKWLENATEGDSLDASKLTSAQQDILFLGNMRKHPKADFAKVWKGEESVEDFWANYHWAGPKEQRSERIQSFNDSLAHFEGKPTATSKVANKKAPQQLAYNEQTPSQLPNTEVSMAQPVQDNIQPVQPYKQQPVLQSNPNQITPPAEPVIEPMNLFDPTVAKDIYEFIGKRKQKDTNQLTAFNTGGKHEENPLGGIPQGIGANGKTNTVEEGETSFDLDEGTFVFSDRITLNDYIKNSSKIGSTNQFAEGGTMNNCGGPGQPPCDENYFQKIRESRQGVRQNADGTVSTHRMSQSDNQAYPTLFQNKDGSWYDLKDGPDNNWAAKKEAIKRNELYTFKNEDEAKAFANGAWKNNQFAEGGFTDPKVKTVKHGSKEYAKAYKEGTFADIPNQLDEVVITADGKTGKNILQDYPNYNKLSKEDKSYWNDPSPIGRSVRRKAQTSKGLAEDAAAMGHQLPEGALAAIQIPQSAMVEGVEQFRGKPHNYNNVLPGGKQRFPSDAWGYKNPKGFLQNAANIGMDAVLDPTNISGAGLLAKGSKLKNTIKELPAAAKATKEGLENVLKDAKDHPLFMKSKTFKNKMEELGDKLHETQAVQNDLEFGLQGHSYKAHKIIEDRKRKLLGELDNKITNKVSNQYRNRQDIKNIERVDGDNLKVQKSPLLSKATTTGEGEIVDFKTGKKVKGTVEVPNESTLFTKEGNTVKQGTSKVSDVEVTPKYRETVKSNIDYLQNVIPGFRVFGSARGVADAKLPHIVGDFDGYISEANYNKHVKDKLPYLRDNGIEDPAKLHKFGDFGEQGDIDFNVIRANKSGKVDGSSRKARELFRQTDPEGYYKEVERLTKQYDGSYKATDLHNEMNIPYTPDELIGKLDELDPTVKTIMDAYESNKIKHTNKIDSYLAYGEVDKVKKAQKQFLKAVAGPKAKLGHQFNPKVFSDPKKNEEILNQLNYLGDKKAVSNDPLRMQMAIDDTYINHTILSRSVGVRDSRKGLDAAQEIVHKSLREWRPAKNLHRSGEANGAGLNHVKFGDSNHYGDIYSHKQLGVKLDTSDPINYIKDLRNQVFKRTFTVDDNKVINDILEKHGFDKMAVSNSGELIQKLGEGAVNPRNKVHTAADTRHEILSEIGEIFNIRSTGNGMNYGNSYYASTLGDFNDKLDTMVHGLEKLMVKPNSLYNRKSRLQGLNLGNQANIDLMDISKFKKVEGLINGGIDKATNRIEALQEIKYYHSNKIDALGKKLEEKAMEKDPDYKLWKEYDTQIDKLSKEREELSDTYRKMQLYKRRATAAGVITGGTALAGFGVNEGMKYSSVNAKEYRKARANLSPEDKEKLKVNSEEYAKLNKMRTELTKNNDIKFREQLRNTPEYKKILDEFQSLPHTELMKRSELNLKMARLANEIIRKSKQK